MLVLSIASLLLLLCHSTAAQEAVDDIPTTMLSYLETPSRGWTIQTGSRVETEVVLSPAKDLLLVAGNDCSMTAISLDGIEQWKYTSSTSLEGCDGGILFGTTVDQVNYAARAIPNVGRLESQIVAVDLADGSSIAYSIGPVPGIVAGTPRITEDQQHLIVTSNTENLSRGHFTVWNVASGTSVLEFASSENRTEPLPFSPLGFQHSPIQGYYDGGFENGNDIFVWGVDNELSSDPAAGLGQLYAFQFPILETDPLRVTLVGGSRGFQTPTEPVFDNGGLSMYWTVTRNELRCWVGEVNMGRDSFDKRPETIDVIPKDSPRANTGMAPPVVTTTSVYGPMAGSQIFRIDLSCAVEELVIVDTAASVNSKILPSLDERFVFYATIEPDSKLYMLNAETMEQVWEHQLTRGVEADMTLSPDGTTVYVVSAGGVLEAVNVGELVALPTESPTRMPTTSPTISSQPTTSAEPTFSATESPTSAPATESPTLAPIMDKSVTDNGTPTPPSSSVTKPTLLVALVIQLLALLC